MSQTPKIFIFGLGYSGLAFAKACHARGWWVGGTCTTSEKRLELQALGLNPIIFDSSKAIEIPKDTTHLLSTIGTDEDRIDTVVHFHQQQIQALPDLEWIGYLSATSVYGDYQGMWVDERAPLRATSERGLRRIKAEALWQKVSPKLAPHIFRLAGIYGPGRNTLDRLKAGKALRILESPVFSRIHVDDIVNILLCAIEHPHPGEIFNCADDEPAPTNEILEYLCELYPLPLPKAISRDDPSLPPMVKSFYDDSKRIRNDKIKQLLGVTLEYPSYRDYYHPINAEHQ